jgi:predicted O-methyltransferase YrrM
MKKISLYRFYCQIRYPVLWRLFGIQTHLTDREKIALYRIASEVSAKKKQCFSFVEIGSYIGASSSYLAAGLAKNHRSGKVYCIDTWNNDAMTEGNRDTMTEFLYNTKEFSSYIEPIRGSSTDSQVVSQVKRLAGKIDLLFIDGDHSVEGVFADWTAYSPLLSGHAIVVMHDIGWAEGVQRVLTEEIKPRVIREQSLPNLWWGWVGK